MTRKTRVRLAAALWIVFAIVVWNVVFDRVLVLAGRLYVRDAAEALQSGGPYLLIDERMRPAIRHGVKVATVTAVPIAVFGLAAVALAARKTTATKVRRSRSENS